jgi:hypothetical protein
MVAQWLVGIGVSVVNIVLHALVMTTVVAVARTTLAHRALHPWLFLTFVMVPTTSVLMLTHVAEVLVRALAYERVGAAAAGSDMLYFAFVNYTTLGYGDIVPVTEWRLLGPITAMNGMLMFGWSIAVIFEVLRRALVYAVGLPD